MAVKRTLGSGRLGTLQDGLIRHVVCLVALGWGDEPCDVVEWFRDIDTLDFLVEGRYIVSSGCGLFSGLTGVRIEVVDPKGREMVFGSGDRDCGTFVIDSDSEMGDFLRCTTPIR